MAGLELEHKEHEGSQAAMMLTVEFRSIKVYPYELISEEHLLADMQTLQ